jgi:hypothetical protein
MRSTNLPFVVTCGQALAPPLVLLHGSGANSMMWAGHVAAWAEHFRIHAIDVIGEPGLSAPSRPPLASDAYAAWLDDVLDLLVHRYFRPRLDRLPRFSTQALAALDMPMLTIVGARDTMLDSHQTRQRLEQAGHLVPSQTQPILDFLLGKLTQPCVGPERD